MHDNEYRGRQILLASLMYRYKLPFLIFFDTYLKVRYDIGSTWPEQESIRFKDLKHGIGGAVAFDTPIGCLLYTSPSPRDRTRSRMPSSA